MPTEKEISNRIIKLYYDYVAQHKGQDAADGILKGFPQDKKALLDEFSWTSLETLIEIVDRMARLFNDEDLPRKVQVAAAKMRSLGLLDILIRFIYPSPKAMFNKLPQFINQFNRSSIIKIVKVENNSATIKTREIDKYFPTNKYSCNAAKGGLACLPALLGYELGEVKEPECSVPIDKKGMIDGKLYEVKDKREVVEFDPGTGERKVIGRLAADGSFELKGILYGARDCLYNVTWKNKSLWARTFGQYFRRKSMLKEAVQKLEEDKVLIEQKYKELEELNAGLEIKVRQRTSDLEHSNKLKDLFISIMDHDIKNYLTIILEYSSIIKSMSKEEVGKYGQVIEKNAKKINELISNARTFSMIESADVEKAFKRYELSAALESITPELKSQAEGKSIELIIDVPKDKYHFNALGMIPEVFLNLIGNAIKYSKENTRIEIYVEDQPDGFIFCVKDSGKGVPDDHKGTIFNRFERLEPQDKGGVEGSGLGLAIVKSLIELHKGRVWVEDNPSGGSIFKVYLAS